jgi:septum formation protein
VKRLILASESPRRRQILEDLGLHFNSVHPNVDEHDFDTLAPEKRVIEIAKAKAMSVIHSLGAEKSALILAADTLVCDPRDRGDARRMLDLLSNRQHLVHTGLVLFDNLDGRNEWMVSTSMVRFSRLDDREIESYLDSGEWQGVAGAYRVQGLGAAYIECIEGSYSGIMGLPIRELYVMFKRLGIDFLSK